MTSAELKTALERLSLSSTWLAKHFGLKSRRSVEYWQSGVDNKQRGKVRVPDDVAEMLTALDTQLWESAEQVVAQTQAAEAECGSPGEILLHRYQSDSQLWQSHPDMDGLPVACHAVLLSRAQWLLAKAGYTAIIEYSD